MTTKEAYYIEKCKDGSHRYQKKLYDLYSEMVWSICLRYLKNQEDAEDAFQNAFISVFKNINDFKDKGAFGGWVRKIAVNSALMVYRSRRSSNLYVELDSAGITTSEEDNALSKLAAEDLMKAIQLLPDGYRIVFNMYGVEGYSHAEIAGQLGISESTSRSQFSRARKLLMNQINNEKISANG